MPGQHPLAVEAVPQVEPDRERVVADPLVEPPVGAARDPLGERHDAGWRSSAWSDRDACRDALRPIPPRPPAGRRTRPAADRRAARRGRSTIPQSKNVRAVSGSATTTQTGRLAHALRAARERQRDPLGERRAVEAVVAQRLGRRAAGGPALDAGDVERRRRREATASARRSVSPSAPTGAWSSTTSTSRTPATVSASQSGSTRSSHGSVDDGDVDARARRAAPPRSAPRAASRARTRRASRRRPRGATTPTPGAGR